ncbi:MAG TPA: sigma-54-dependent Fis family transcriptional regulator [Deltaproteobacteria bacterium]|nr:sigma-54-dependent Fis family transcriptional regulator [Deltaproteobacteria bacterium]
MKRKKVLIVDDEQSLLESLEMFFSDSDYEVACAGTAREGLERTSTFQPDVIILDIRLPDKDGFQVIEELRRQKNTTPIIMITAFHDMETTIRTVKLGAFEYIPKPIDVDELERAVRKALKVSSPLSRDTISLNGSLLYERQMIIGKSAVMKEIFKAVGRVSENRVTVLIEGETGTGKELVAQAIHSHSSSKDEPFIVINCSTIVPTLLESELFGHEKGSFTGATNAKRGKVELAAQGTILLDEVGEIPLDIQAKLLRFLQEKEFERVGGEKKLHSNARFIAATNRDLRKMVRAGQFREDLYYRLSVATIKLPPLRERTSDIPLLVDYLITRINQELGLSIKRVETDAMNSLMGYEWPGNVRELENVLTRAVMGTHGDVIDTDTLAPLLSKADEQQAETQDKPSGAAMSLQEYEREYILRVLNRTEWHLGRACEALGISRPTLRQKMREYGLRE